MGYQFLVIIALLGILIFSRQREVIGQQSVDFGYHLSGGVDTFNIPTS